MKFYQPKTDSLSLTLTPLIDVVFLLLIFFMTTTTFNQYSALELTLPTITQQQPYEPSRVLEVRIALDGQMQLNGQGLASTSVAELKQALRANELFDPSQHLVIYADKQASHQSVMQVMDAAGQLGYRHIQLMGDYHG